jgi:hypothetical protein
LGVSRGGYTALAALGREPSSWHRAVLLMGLYDPVLLVAAEQTEPGSFIPSRPELGRTWASCGWKNRSTRWPAGSS